jgi:hypothetical protein
MWVLLFYYTQPIKCNCRARLNCGRIVAGQARWKEAVPVAVAVNGGRIVAGQARWKEAVPVAVAVN